MKQYRYKNVSELKREFGEGWREEADVLPSEDGKLGKMLTNKQNAIIEQANGGKDGVDRLLLKLAGIDMRQIIEVPQISCDVEKVYFDGKKRRVTVKLRNGNEGRSTCSPEDVFDPYVGFAVAYFRLRKTERTLDIHIFCKGSIMKRGKGKMPSNCVYSRD